MSITFTSMNTLRIAAHLITALDLKVSFLSLSLGKQFIQPGTEFLSRQKQHKISHICPHGKQFQIFVR